MNQSNRGTRANSCYRSNIFSGNISATLWVCTCIDSKGYSREGLFPQRKAKISEIKWNKYLLLTEFEVRTVSYGPSIFSFTYEYLYILSEVNRARGK